MPVFVELDLNPAGTVEQNGDPEAPYEPSKQLRHEVPSDEYLGGGGGVRGGGGEGREGGCANVRSGGARGAPSVRVVGAGGGRVLSREADAALVAQGRVGVSLVRVLGAQDELSRHAVGANGARLLVVAAFWGGAGRVVARGNDGHRLRVRRAEQRVGAALEDVGGALGAEVARGAR